jgi:polar amino acid transport system substrate-binding protein
MITDIVNTVYSQMGRKTEINYVPNNQLRGVTFNGRTEVSYPLTKNTNDEMLFLYSEPLYTTLTVFFAKVDSEVEDMENTMEKRMRKGKFTKLIVAVPVGFNSDKLMKYYEDKYILLKPMKTLEDCFKAMSEGTVDLVAAPQIAGLVAIQNSGELNRADFKILEKSIESTTLHLVVSKEHPNAEGTIKEFNDAFEAAKASGKIGKVIDVHIDLIQKSRP